MDQCLQCFNTDKYIRQIFKLESTQRAKISREKGQEGHLASNKLCQLSRNVHIWGKAAEPKSTVKKANSTKPNAREPIITTGSSSNSDS